MFVIRRNVCHYIPSPSIKNISQKYCFHFLKCGSQSSLWVKVMLNLVQLKDRKNKKSKLKKERRRKGGKILLILDSSSKSVL